MFPSRTAENCGFSAVAVHRWSSTSFRAAEADPHCPVYSADHRGSAVAVRFCVRCPCVCGPCSLSGAVVERTFVLPQLHLVEKLPRFSAVAVHHGRRHSLRGTDADPHGPCNHGESQLCVDRAVDPPGMQVVLFRSSSLAPCIWQSLYCVRCCLWSFGL